MKGIYEQFRDACKSRGKTLTQVLHEIGRSDGSTGSWKKGQYPRLDIVMEIANHLDMSLDELVFRDASRAKTLTENDREWLAIAERIPPEKQQICKDFLRTHMQEPEKYVDKKRA